jgi:cytochrome c
MLRVLISFAALVLMISTPFAFASEFGTKEEAVAMVKRVQEKFQKDGADATFKSISDQSGKEFHDRDLYAFVYDLKGFNVAHGSRPALIGKNLIDLKDQDGTYLIRAMVKIATGPGSGWIDYKWPNPLTNKIEDKTTYVERMGDYLVGVGVYRP